MKKLNKLWNIPGVILVIPGFIIGAIGVGVIIIADMCFDKAKEVEK